jgi:hypothetical protein
MRVDFSGWYCDHPGRITRKFTYSKLAGARDFAMEAWFDIRPDHSIVSFLISDLDLKKETPVRLTLRHWKGDQNWR